MGLEDIVQQLKGARTTLVGDRDRIDAEIGRLDTAIAALDGADGTKVQTINTTGLKVTMTTTSPKATDKKPARATTPGALSPKQQAARDRWQPVFEYVKATKANGTYTFAATIERFGSWAKNWSTAAKQYGVQIEPSAEPAPEQAEPTPQAKGVNVLACDDCNATFEVDRLSRLRTHTVAIHGRPPSNTERMPIANPNRGAA